MELRDLFGWEFPRERRIRKYEKLGNFTMKPWGDKYYALYDADELICVTVYRKGCLEVMKRLHQLATSR